MKQEAMLQNHVPEAESCPHHYQLFQWVMARPVGGTTVHKIHNSHTSLLAEVAKAVGIIHLVSPI